MGYLRILLLICLLGSITKILAQPQTLEIEQQKQTAYQLNTPFKAIYNHYHNLERGSYNPTLASYSLAVVGNLTPEQRLEHTIQLYQVLKGNGLYFDEEEIPKASDYLDTLRKKNIYIPFENFPEIFLVRTNFRGQYIWVYSPETVAAIPSLYARTFPFGSGLIFGEFLQEKNPEIIFGLDYLRLLALLFLLIVPFLFFKLFNRIVAIPLRRLVGRLTEEDLKKRRIRRLARPLSLYVTFFLVRRLIPFFLFPVLWSYYLLFIVEIAMPVFALLMVLALVDFTFIYLEKNINREKHGWYVQMLPFFRTLIKIIAITLGLIVILENLDLNVTALLAGLSIGGLAFALAAQDTIKNLFGSVMIFIDQPFRVGDWIMAEGIDGEVEEIGVRSTRVRTFYNSVLHVPNGKMADMTIDNLGMRVFRRYRTTLGVTYDTPPALMRAFLEGVREIIKRHPDTRKDVYAVHFLDYQNASLGILLNVFFLSPDFSEEWKSRESLNLEIFELAAFLGIRFAFPTQTIHIEQMPGHESLSPKYNDLSPEALNAKLSTFFEQKKQTNTQD